MKKPRNYSFFSLFTPKKPKKPLVKLVKLLFHHFLVKFVWHQKINDANAAASTPPLATTSQATKNPHDMTLTPRLETFQSGSKRKCHVDLWMWVRGREVGGDFSSLGWEKVPGKKTGKILCGGGEAEIFWCWIFQLLGRDGFNLTS